MDVVHILELHATAEMVKKDQGVPFEEVLKEEGAFYLLDERGAPAVEGVDSILNGNVETVQKSVGGVLSADDLVALLAPGGLQEAKLSPTLSNLPPRQLALLLLWHMRERSEMEDLVSASPAARQPSWGRVKVGLSAPLLTTSSLPNRWAGIDWLLHESVDLDRDVEVGSGMPSFVDCVAEFARRAAEVVF